MPPKKATGAAATKKAAATPAHASYRGQSSPSLSAQSCRIDLGVGFPWSHVFTNTFNSDMVKEAILTVSPQFCAHFESCCCSRAIASTLFAPRTMMSPEYLLGLLTRRIIVTAQGTQR